MQTEPKLPSELPISQPRHVGKDSARMEDPLLLTGRVEYGNDIRTPGMLTPRFCAARTPMPGLSPSMLRALKSFPV